MKNNILVTVGILVICFQVYNLNAQSTCHLRELDLCAATLLVFTQSPSGIATGDAELDKQCGYLKEADVCLQNYTKRCTTPLQRELIGFMTEGSQKLIKEYCTRGSGLRQSYLKHATCLNTASRGQKECIKDLQSAFEVITTVEWDKRIKVGCCAYNQVLECSEKIIENKCGKDATEFMRLLMRMALSRLPDIVCSEYKQGSKICRSLLPPPGTPPKGTRSNSVLSRLFSAYTGL